MAGIEIGSVSVSVVPSAEGFADKIRADILPQADQLGIDIGERMRVGIESRLSDIRLGVNADTATASAELDKIRVKADEIGAKKESIKVDVNNNQSGGVLGWLVSLVAGAVAIAPALAVAGVGIGAFGGHWRCPNSRRSSSTSMTWRPARRARRPHGRDSTSPRRTWLSASIS